MEELNANLILSSNQWIASQWNIDNDEGAGEGLDAPYGYDPYYWKRS